MHQSGIENVVASSGTSLTTGQIRLLHRFTPNITVLYDGDSAGIKASLRGIDMLLSEGLNIKVVLLPDGEDPDSFARSHNAAAFQEYIEKNQVDFIRFKTDLLMRDTANDPVKRASLVQDIVKSIAAIPDAIVRQMYVRECAAMMNVGEPLILDEIRRQRKVRQGEHSATPEEEKPATESQITPQAENLSDTKAEREERLLMSLVVRYGDRLMYAENELAEGEENISVAKFVMTELQNDGLQLRIPLYRRVLEEAVAGISRPDFHAQTYFINHPDPDLSRLAAEVAEDKYQLSRYHFKQQKMVMDEQRLAELAPRLVNDYKHFVVREEMASLLRELARPEVAADETRCLSLMNRYRELANVAQCFAQVLGDRVVSP